MVDAEVYWGPEPIGRPWDEWVDGPLLWLILLVAAAEAALLLMAYAFPPDSSAFDLERYEQPNRFVRLYLQPVPERERALTRRDPGASASWSEPSRPAPAARAQLVAQRPSSRRPGDPAQALAEARRRRDREVVLRTSVLRLLDSHGGSAGLGDVLAAEGLGDDIERELGGVTGAQAAAGTGLGPYTGLNGRGPGGPGGPGTGLARLGTLDTGAGLVHGATTGPLGPPAERRITIEPGPATILDALSREQIRRTVHARRRQVKACYDRALARRRGVYGKVLVRFVIGATGSVLQARAVENTSGDAALEACLLTRVRNWRFPKPLGGGKVVVRYPFLFTPAGNGT